MPFLQLHPDLPKFGFGADYVPPAAENAAVPVVTTPTGAGQSVGHPPEPCLFPQRFHDREPYPFGTGLLEYRVARDGFDYIDFLSIDAPDVLPYGGVRCVVARSVSFASAAAFRR